MNSHSRESFNLFNESFCGLSIMSGILGYQTVTSKPCPYPLLFLLLPTVFHTETRVSIPRSGRTSLHSWLQDTSHIRIGYAERCEDFVDITRQSIRFLLQRSAISISPEGVAISADITIPQRNTFSNESKEILSRAETLGKLFGKAGSCEVIYALFGVKP
jgi:hypothetical protein